MECKRDSNSESCTCAAKDCARHGLCCGCVRNHLAKKSLPGCMRNLDWIKVTAG